MNDLFSTSLDIKLKRKHGRIIIRLKSGNFQSSKARGEILETDFERERHMLISSLNDYITHDYSEEYANRLKKTGHDAYNVIRHNLSTEARKIWNEFNRKATRLEGKIRVFMPYELTFPFSLLHPDKPEITSPVAGFLGAKHQIMKFYGKQLEPKSVADHPDERRPLTIYHMIGGSELSYVNKERKYIKKLCKKARCECVYSKQQPALEHLRGCLNKHGARFADIIHFSCHMEFDEKNNQHRLLLNNNEKVSPHDLLGDLQSMADEKPTDELPIAFFNTCNSGVASFDTPSSFIYYWTGKLCSGSIATLSRVDDELAYRLSNAFYDKIFSGRSLGLALFSTKETLLFDENRLDALAFSPFNLDMDRKLKIHTL